jgi:hypothetical protein
MTKNDFECFLNEMREPINLFGVFLDAGTLLRDQDSFKFNEMYHDYLEANDLVDLDYEDNQ